MSSRVRITIETFNDNTTLAEKTEIIYDDEVATVVFILLYFIVDTHDATK